jgi:Na+/melibiose symporter-like transporter
MDKLLGLIIVGFLIFFIGVSVLISSRLDKDDNPNKATDMIIGGGVTSVIGIIVMLFGIFNTKGHHE